MSPVYAEPENSPALKNPLIHVIVNDDIQSIMKELNLLVDARGYTALQIHEKRAQHFKDLLVNADKLVIAAENLTDAIPGIRISPENQITFEALAKQLQREALFLRASAESADHIALEPIYQRMQQTCDACHQLFRF